MRLRGIGCALGALLLTGATDAPEPITVNLVLTGLRSNAGEVRVCVWREPASFPNCRKRQDVRMLAAPAAPEVRLTVTGLAPDSYAISAIHDENGNRQLDKSLIGIPTEGVGFSHNPRITFGPPAFDKARFDASREPTQTIRMKYFF
jgi:uncharacterized protein (DUF2141 family)